MQLVDWLEMLVCEITCYRFQGQPQHLKYQNWILKKCHLYGNCLLTDTVMALA